MCHVSHQTWNCFSDDSWGRALKRNLGYEANNEVPEEHSKEYGIMNANNKLLEDCLSRQMELVKNGETSFDWKVVDRGCTAGKFGGVNALQYIFKCLVF